MRCFILAVFLSFWVPASGALACQCNPERLDAAKRKPLDYAVLAFVADVDGVEETTQGALATFHIVKYWKGVSDPALVTNVMIHSTCGLNLHRGERYLVVSVVEPTFGMNVCNTELTPIKKARKRLALLGKGRTFKR